MVFLIGMMLFMDVILDEDMLSVMGKLLLINEIKGVFFYDEGLLVLYLCFVKFYE